MLDVLMRGISTRQYAEVLPEMASSCGVSKSNVSREAAEAGEEGLKVGREVHKHIFAGRALNKPVTFSSVKPFHYAVLSH